MEGFVVRVEGAGALLMWEMQERGELDGNMID